jgi:phosphate transport system permease protein
MTSKEQMQAQAKIRVRRALIRRRHRFDGIMTIISLLMTAAVLFTLGAILVTLFINGIQAIKPSLFLESTPAPGSQGGLANAIFGSVVMTALAVLIAAPIGVMSGTFLAEYARNSRLADGVRFINDVLLSAPSIIIGLFVYGVVVLTMGHFSAWAGIIALAIIAIPIIVRTTEDMLSLVPDSLREAGAALGTPRWKVITAISYRAAFQGILTGVLLAIARVSGETAPLLFTALNNQFWSTNLNAPMANLPVVIFQFAMSPYEDWRSLAWGGALLITTTVLALNVVARLSAKRKRA